MFLTHISLSVMFISRNLIRTAKFHRLLSSSPSTFLPIQSLIKLGISPTPSSFKQHLLHLCHNHKLTYVLSFLTQMKKIQPLRIPISQFWNSLIRVLSDKDPEKALSLLKEYFRFRNCCNGNDMVLVIENDSLRKLIVGLCDRGDVSRLIEVLELMNDGIVECRFDNFVVSFVIASFCRIGEVRLAIEFFEKANTLGKLVPNLVTYTAVVNAYCLLGRVEDVGELFCKMESEGIVFDVVFYTSWIVGYFRKGFLRDGFCKYGKMLEGGIKPDEVCYSVLIDGFSKCGDVEKAVGLLNRMKRDGVEPNILAYTSIMTACCKKGKFEEALSTYKKIKELGISVDEVAYATLIDGACELGKFDEALEILNDFTKSPLNSVKCYQCIISGLCRKGMAGMAADLFVKLNEEKIVLDIGTYMTLVNAVLKEKGAAKVLNLINMIRTLPQALFCSICNETIILMCKSGDTVTDTVFDLYIMMASSGSVPSSRAYYLILRGVIAEGEHRVASLILNKFVKEYGLTDFMVGKALVHFLCMKGETSAIKFLRYLKDEKKVTVPVISLTKLSQNGRALDAYNLLKEAENKLPVMDVVDSSIMVNGLCKEGHIHFALDLCRFLEKHGIAPNIVTYNSILHGLCQQGCLVEAFRLFDSLETLKLSPTVITYSILIDALCKEGFFFKAEWLLEKMALDGLIPNVWTFNSLIDGYCKFGYFEKSSELYYGMQEKGVESDQFTVGAVINGFDLKGDMQGALDFFDEIKRKGGSPDFLGFLYLIRGLLTKGRMEEARGILKEMLQTKSVRDSLNKVDAEVETESIESFLIDLCDRGCIKEAVTILDEVGCMLFPLGFASTHKQKILRSGTEANVSITDSSLNTVGKHSSQSKDFDHFYPAIASYCLDGKLQDANNLVKQMLQQFSVVQECSA